MSAVLRKREAVAAGQAIARRGGHAADPKVARREALEAIRARTLAEVSQSADETAKLIELAAANPDMRAGPLLEAYGQGGRGPLRTLPWWRWNGCRIRKHAEGIAVSMFGSYVFGRDQVDGPDPGGIGTRVTAAEAFPEGLEGYPIAILRARAGERLRAVWSEPELFSDTAEAPVIIRPAQVDPLPSFEVLEAAIAAVRAYDETATDCISCDGAGCVLCSCQESSGKVSVKPRATVSTMTPRASQPADARPAPVETVRVQAKPIGRPRKIRPERIPGITEAFARVAGAEHRLAAAHSARRDAIHAALESGYSLADIASIVGVTRARIHQISRGD